MSKFRLAHHQLIYQCLQNFNYQFLVDNYILFGGGTRISLEIDEYRESIDIDFLCRNKTSYRAVREQATNLSLGDLVISEFDYCSEIKFNRDAVRAFIKIGDIRVKLEFVCFDNYELGASTDYDRFPVPFIDHLSCFYTKLLANADRAGDAPYKDIIDILAMIWRWGEIPDKAFELAESHYGDSVKRSLHFSLEHLFANQDDYVSNAVDMSMDVKFFEDELQPIAASLLNKLRPI